MKDAARFLVLAFAILVIIAVLVVWKKNDRTLAFEELRERYEADINQTEEDFIIGCDSERLVDLVDFAEVVARAGEPTILDLTGAPNLESFAGIEKLLSVESLIAIDCPKFVSAEGVTRLPNLRELVFTDSRKFSDPAAIRDLPALETVDFSGCVELEAVDVSRLPALRNLYFSRCRKLQILDVSALTDLEQLYLDGCSSLESVEGLGELSALTDLDISNATRLKSIEGVSGLSNLIVLDIRNVDITDFSEIGTLQSLRILRMGGQDAIETLEPFAGLPGLREIHLEACPNFHSLKGLPPTVNQYAGFTHCPKLTSLSGVEKATTLEQLDLTGCANLQDITSLARLEALVQLSLVKCRQVTDITPVVELEKLVIVMLGGSGVVPAATEDLKTANKEIIFDFFFPE